MRSFDSLGRLFIAVLLSSIAVLVEAAPTISAASAGKPFPSSALDLSKFGFVEQEFFIAGTADAYRNTAPLTSTGMWNVSVNPGLSAQYVTRILVRRPTKSQRFNGAVIVEWLNVSGGSDAAPDWGFARAELIREGYAWVGVSAQYVGATALKQANSARYASINHPGDSWSYDIFSQAGAAVAHPAASISQSSTGGIGGVEIPPPAGSPATPNVVVPPITFVRSDVVQPVLFVNTETDITFLGTGFSVHAQSDSPTLRMWEGAGSIHAISFASRLFVEVSECDLQVDRGWLSASGRQPGDHPASVGRSHSLIYG